LGFGTTTLTPAASAIRPGSGRGGGLAAAEQPPGELTVRVGLGEAHPAMQDLALIGMTIRMANGLPAKIAVLGPMRMQYERVITAVIQTSRALEAAQF